MRKFQKVFIKSIISKFLLFLVIMVVGIVLGKKTLTYFDIDQYFLNFFGIKYYGYVMERDLKSSDEKEVRRGILYFLLNKEIQKNKTEKVDFSIMDINSIYKEHKNDFPKNIKGLQGQLEHFEILLDKLKFFSNFSMLNTFALFHGTKVYSNVIKEYTYIYSLNGKNNINIYYGLKGKELIYKMKTFTFIKRSDGLYIFFKNKNNLEKIAKKNGNDIHFFAKLPSSKKWFFINLLIMKDNEFKYMSHGKNGFYIGNNLKSN